MKIVAYYHILMVNNWKEIVEEQLMLIEESGLYEQLDEIKIGCLGESKKELDKIVQDFPKAKICYHSKDTKEYEFPTLEMLYQDSLKEEFMGLYFHTKSVSFPKHVGGKYWRDHMNYYNITDWETNMIALENGYDLSGVKLIVWENKLHYSGNFFWFKSNYIKTLKPFTAKQKKDRCQAEFWSCKGKGNFACTNDEQIDYNAKGVFKPPINYVHTLAYNLVPETEKAVKSLYELNSNFHHIIVDLDFPIEKGNFIPKNIRKAKQNNSMKLRKMARKYGSEYLKIPNIGVSQNWTAVYKHLKMNPDDILIGADPDERPQQDGWVSAMASLLRGKRKIGMVSLSMPEQTTSAHDEVLNVNGIWATIPVGLAAWALIGFRGDFLDKMKGVPVPRGALRYGWIENVVHSHFSPKGFGWVMLPDYKVVHTDYEWGSEGSSKLLREWKNLIVHQIKAYGQISFDEFLEKKKSGELDNVKLHYR